VTFLKTIDILVLNFKKNNSPITSILVSIIISEVGNISRFGESSKLIAYTSIDTTIFHIRKFWFSYSIMSKEDSPYLRNALFIIYISSL